MQKQLTATELAAARSASAAPSGAEAATFAILVALSVSHMLNDVMQSLIPALYPMFRTDLNLSFLQIGLITASFQVTASLLQPVIGSYTDRHPLPYSLPVGMAFTLVGLLLLSRAGSLPMVMGSAAMVGIGSAVFHPESSRVARVASGGRHGTAQALFQVGGNTGSALGPLVAAYLVMPRGQTSIAWAAVIALLAMLILGNVSRWYAPRVRGKAKARVIATSHGLSPSRVRWSIGILIALMFSKFVYLASLSSYLTLYLIDHFGVSNRSAQLHLFAFLAAGALGTFVGGPIGDRFGRKMVIWGSIVGVLPFTLILPHANLFWTSVLMVPIGFVLSSAFSAIIVFAQELVPGKVGLISGLFFGFAFGLGGLGAAALGGLADLTSIDTVYQVCAFLPVIGFAAFFLPRMQR